MGRVSGFFGRVWVGGALAPFLKKAPNQRAFMCFFAAGPPLFVRDKHHYPRYRLVYPARAAGSGFGLAFVMDSLSSVPLYEDPSLVQAGAFGLFSGGGCQPGC